MSAARELTEVIESVELFLSFSALSVAVLILTHSCNAYALHVSPVTIDLCQLLVLNFKAYCQCKQRVMKQCTEKESDFSVM